MTKLLVIAAAIISGNASRYDVGVMQATIDARIEMGHLTEAQVAAHDAYIAVEDCGDIGRSAWVWFEGADSWIHALVADCAVRDDSDGARSWMRDNAILFEIDGVTAQEAGYTELGARRAALSWDRPPLWPE